MDIQRALSYIDTVLRAHRDAGLTLEAKHFYTVKDMLCDATAVPSPSSLPLDTNLATEPVKTAAKRLLKA
jgi:hypothetical protein